MKTQNRKSERRRLIRNTIFVWTPLVIAAFLAIEMIEGRAKVIPLTYSQFRTEVTRGNVKSVLIRTDRSLTGTLTHAIVVDGTESNRFRTVLPAQSGESFLADLEEKNVEIRATSSEGKIFSWLLNVFLVLCVFSFVRSLFKKSPHGPFHLLKAPVRRMDDEAQAPVTFADVAGADEAKADLQEVVQFLREPERFARLGGRMPRGILLVGPPGTGKTLLARAVAGEAGCTFLSISGSEFVQMVVGVGAARVRDLFEQAKAEAPAIIFIDEIDAVGKARGNVIIDGGHDEREQTLNQLLVAMDGFEPNDGIVVLAATNRPDILDPALLRPGRFDRQVVVDTPDIKGREEILRVHTRKIQLDGDVDIAALARSTPGMSGADLANLVNEAALIAARCDSNTVNMQHFEAARDRILLGTERRSMVLSEKERKLTAYHEAGHAVVALKIPGLDPLHKVTIIPRGRALGVTAALPDEDRRSYTKEYLEGHLVMLFGGRAAEEVIFGPAQVTTGAANDIDRATQVARAMVTQFGMSERIGLMALYDDGLMALASNDLAKLVDKEVKALLDTAYQKAVTLIRNEHSLLDRIASALLEKETIDREEIEKIAATTTPSSLPERLETVLGSAEQSATDFQDTPELSKQAEVMGT